VPGCCLPLSRRQLLRWASLLSATPLLGPWYDGRAARAAVRGSTAGPVPMDAELVTVTDTSIVVTWFTGDPARLDAFGRPAPLPADTRLALFELGGRQVAEVRRDDATAYHHAEVTGLTPGTPYRYEARSAGRLAAPRLLPTIDYAALPAAPTSVADLARAVDLATTTSASPGVVTTLTPPEGPVLMTLALANDLHVGETVSGLVTGAAMPGFRQDVAWPPYPEVMARAMVEDARARGADVLLVAGDLTAEAEPAQVRRSRELLDRFGTLRSGGELARGDYVVTRGNHDRPHEGAAYGDCPPEPEGTAHRDCLAQGYDVPRQRVSVSDVGGLRILGLDTTRLATAGGTMSDAQLAELRTELARDPDRPTLLFGHHPVTAAAAATTVGGAGFDLEQGAARRLEALYAAAPGVFLHHSGHTHRTRRTAAPDTAPGVEFLEVGAVKEYPGGYALVRVHPGGYQVNFYRSRDPLAREWGARTSGQYFGVFPSYVLGSVADRNHVVARDFSGLRGLPGVAASRSGRGLPSALPLAAAGLTAGAVALGAARARGRPSS